jgi:hypothetical protein
MPAWYEIRWLPEGRTEKFAGSRGNYYEFSESDHLDVYSVPVWCHRCATVTHGENLSSVEEIDKQIRDFNDPSSDLYRMTQNSLLADLAMATSFDVSDSQSCSAAGGGARHDSRRLNASIAARQKSSPCRPACRSQSQAAKVRFRSTALECAARASTNGSSPLKATASRAPRGRPTGITLSWTSPNIAGA